MTRTKKNTGLTTKVYNIFIFRCLLFTFFALILCVVLEHYKMSASSGLYFIPFVILLIVIERIHLLYDVRPMSLLNKYTLLFLVVYYLVYSYIFLIILGESLDFYKVPYLLMGHIAHFLFAVFLSTMYGKLRARKRNNKTGRK